MKTTLLLNSSTLLTLMIIHTPTILPLASTFKNSTPSVTRTVKTSFLTSLITAITFIPSGTESFISNWEWKFIMNFKIQLSLKMDSYSITFLPIALCGTSFILQFASRYMTSEPHITKFFSYLLIFLTMILLLITANNMFLLFLGWEGVGIMSFLLIGWWFARMEVNTSTLQALPYNRIETSA